ncbi:MAG: ribosome biogenesis GTPase Der [Nitrospirota bacterium]
MQKPIVAIVGRANVGKSTLFNKMVGKRSAIIEDFPGITRDRLYGDAVWEDKHFLVVDTGGFLHEPDEEIYREVKNQVIAAVEEADLIIMLMDVDSGVLPLDAELIDSLRKYSKSIFYAVNKVDGPKKEKAIYDFYSLGVDLYPLSALNGYGYEDLMEKVIEQFPEGEEGGSEHPKIAIVGRPNVGKSTLVNSLLSKERMIVSSIAGTTRDAVDSVCSYYKKEYTLVDTAGIRRKGKMAQTIERYSFLRTLRNIEECDVALIVLNASDGVVELDQKIAGYVHSAGKGAVILLNKWDLVDKEKFDLKDVQEDVYKKLWFMRYAPVLSISALNKKRVTKLFPLVDKIIAESARRVTTHQLNLFLRKAFSIKEPPLYRNRRVKIYYITQVKTNPPSFLIFTNKKEGIKEQYIRFLEKQLRAEFVFEGVPVEFFVRQRKQK